MTGNELKKLNRKELLEILLEQTKRIESLEEELEQLQQKFDQRNILIKESGTLAEASLKLSNIFKEADETVEIYIKNIKDQMKKEEKEFKKECKEKKEKMLKEVEEKCTKKELEIEKRLKEIEEKEKKMIKDKTNKKVKKTNTEKTDSKRKHRK